MTQKLGKRKQGISPLRTCALFNQNPLVMTPESFSWNDGWHCFIGPKIRRHENFANPTLGIWSNDDKFLARTIDALCNLPAEFLVGHATTILLCE
jgi:hypothetical protein